MSATKRDAICDAALDLFVARGIAGATTREIARRAGTAEGNLYRHFNGKEALARHLFEVCARRFSEALERASARAQTPEGRLAGLVRGIFAFAEQDPRALAYILHRHQEEFAQGVVAEEHPPPRRLFTSVLRDGMRSGRFREIDPDLAAAWIVGMTQRAVMLLRTGRVPKRAAGVVEETVAAALRIVAPGR